MWYLLAEGPRSACGQLLDSVRHQRCCSSSPAFQPVGDATPRFSSGLWHFCYSKISHCRCPGQAYEFSLGLKFCSMTRSRAWCLQLALAQATPLAQGSWGSPGVLHPGPCPAVARIWMARRVGSLSASLCSSLGASSHPCRATTGLELSPLSPPPGLVTLALLMGDHRGLHGGTS